MTQEQIKNAEWVVKLALEIYADKQDKWDANIETITKEAFAELRVKPLHQTTLQRRDCEIDHLKEELHQYKNAIDNLRGYITFLESKISKLEHQLDEHYE
jgi:peptidoglycan hydrolase CwlO-like protein